MAKKRLYFRPAAPDSSSSACVSVQGDDAVGQLYLIPAALYHVSGGTEQAVRTWNESEADRPDRTATGDRGHQRDREWLDECVTRQRQADLGLHACGDISQEVWA